MAIKSRIWEYLTFILVSWFVMNSNLYSGDMFFNLMNGQQDTLVKGKVIKQINNQLVLSIFDVISGINPGKKINVDISSIDKVFLPNDIVLLSLSKKNIFTCITKKYEIEWGIYKLESLENFDVIKQIARDDSILENLVLSIFINNKDKIKGGEFAYQFKSMKLFIIEKDNQIQIFPKTEEGMIELEKMNIDIGIIDYYSNFIQ